MISFRLQEHSIRNVQIVEIYNGEMLVGTIYPQEWGIRLVSKYLDGSPDKIKADLNYPVALDVRLP